LTVDAFDKVVAALRTALAHPASAGPHSNSAAPTGQTVLRQLELVSQFASELERVGGKFMGRCATKALPAAIIKTPHDAGPRKVVLGDGVTSAVEPIAQALTRGGYEVVRIPAIDDHNRGALRDQLASCDLGIIEADYAIAATGTFCIVAGGPRPSALTILPPANFIYVAAHRILPDLASVIAAIGAERFAANRVALITGPSRTADIEKMIVIGVHGPKQLYAAALE